jgi:predicted nuclease of restriction endonuclease-like (RecB) superfamily
MAKRPRLAATKTAATTPSRPQPSADDLSGHLFGRIAAILDQARTHTVRSINHVMVFAYWHIGEEITQQIQEGSVRAAYGQQVLASLSLKLQQRYGRGYSLANLRLFRQFYQCYADRRPIPYSPRSESADPAIRDAARSELTQAIDRQGFKPGLSWTHYRVLMRVDDAHERLFYEVEADREGWSVETLERQIHTHLFLRLKKSRNKAGVLALAADGQQIERPDDLIKHPLILDFLGLDDRSGWHEDDLESAITQHLQHFLLELGKGFAFVKRQYRVDTEHSHFYVDLVFYNYLLKCFLLIDLKLGKLTHQDVGQMDMYVRMFDALKKAPDDNPTIGLILCAQRDAVVAKYSVLNESRQLFASRYMLYLPSEEELRRELRREQRLIAETQIEPSGTPRDV